MKAFIIEDELGLQNLYKTILRNTAYDILTANDGDIAISMFEEGLVPDLIILDIRMPNRDGLEVIKYLQNHPKISDMHVVIATATQQFEQYSTLLPSVDFLLKPVFSAQLLEIVEAVHGAMKLKV